MNKLNKTSLGFVTIFSLIASLVQAQDCYDSPNLMTSTKKEFIVHDNGTVTHLPTGIIWKQCLEGLTGNCTVGEKLSLNWQEALEQVEAVNTNDGFAGHSDWRLPNPKEVMSIMEYGCFRPSINLSVFPNMSGTRIWLSTASENVTNLKSWFANYGEIDVGGESGSITDLNANRQSQSYSVHLVRGAQ